MDRNTIECAEDQTECVDRYCSILARRDNFPIIVKMCVNERGRLITELLGGFFFDLIWLCLFCRLVLAVWTRGEERPLWAS